MNLKVTAALMVTVALGMPAHARDQRLAPPSPAFTVRAVPEAVPQGAILQVVVRAMDSTGRKEMRASLADHTAEGFAWTKGELRVMLPIAADAPPGPSSVRLEVVERSGDKHEVSVPFTVVLGAFDTDVLSVGRKFISPSARQRARARDDSRAFQRLWARPPQERMWRGSFVSPLPNRVTGTFGTFRTFNGQVRSRHMGLDLNGKVGEPVVAPNDGQVIMVRDCFYSGKTVVIDHGARVYTMHFHLSSFNVGVGDRVKRGQMVGRVGLTGRVTGPHLHFGVKLGKTYVDPLALLALDLTSDPRRIPTRAVVPKDRPPGNRGSAQTSAAR